MRTVIGLCLSVCVLAIAGCSRLSVGKVDELRLASLLWPTKGFRYYMPRPYLHVTQTPGKPGSTILIGKVAAVLSSSKDKVVLPVTVAANLREKTIRIDLQPPTVVRLVDQNGKELPHAGAHGHGAYEVKVPAAQTDFIFVKAKDLAHVARNPSVVTLKAVGVHDPALVGDCTLALGPDDAAKPNDKAYIKSEGNKPPEPPQLTMTVIYLPDTTRELTVNPTGGIGTLKYELALKDGWMLTSVSNESDSKVPETITATAGLVTAVGDVASKFFIAGDDAGATQRQLTPGWYAFEADKDTGMFVRLVPITLAAPPASGKQDTPASSGPATTPPPKDGYNPPSSPPNAGGAGGASTTPPPTFPSNASPPVEPNPGAPDARGE